MTASYSNQFKQFWNHTNQWFRDTPERALDQAYDAALKIRALELEHFKGEKIASESAEYSDRVVAYFNSELKKYLKIIQSRLMVFNTSRSLFGLSEQINPNSQLPNDHLYDPNKNGSCKPIDPVSTICEKLEFIDAVICRYEPEKPSYNPHTLVKTTALTPVSLRDTAIESNFSVSNNTANQNITVTGTHVNSGKSIRDELTSNPSTSVLPRSLLGTLNRIQRELRPESEEEVLKNHRKAKVKTLISIRFILLLILVPLLTQQLAKNFVAGPFVDRLFTNQEQTPTFLNFNMEEEAFMELQHYEERLKFQQLIGQAPDLNPEKIEEKLKEKAQELAEEYKIDSSNAIKNVFADIIAVITFAIILVYNRKEVEILKSFMGDVIYGLSDSAKAFIIILLTDMFVGFHSPHGWEVILESIARHFGLPENRDFNFLFIATFPVILDAVFKYWIFRYLNRSSPSAVSTYKTMNE